MGFSSSSPRLAAGSAFGNILFFPEVSKSLVHVSAENYDFGDPPHFKKPTNIDYRFFIRHNK